MANRFKSDLTWNDVTPENVFLNRRAFMAGATALATTGIAGPALASQYSTDEEPNAWEEITQYNNFYEFGTGKSDPSEYASALTTDPWEVEIDGLAPAPRPGYFACRLGLNHCWVSGDYQYVSARLCSGSSAT